LRRSSGVAVLGASTFTLFPLENNIDNSQLPGYVVPTPKSD
jgi:hypothetical protein